MLCRRDYDERLVAIFSNQIQPEYYGGNRSLSINSIILEPLSELPQIEMNSSKKTCPQHAVFHFFSDDSKKDSTTTTTQSNCFIELLKNLKN